MKRTGLEPIVDSCLADLQSAPLPIRGTSPSFFYRVGNQKIHPFPFSIIIVNYKSFLHLIYFASNWT